VNLRHAAALGLLGWYLIFPPPIAKGNEPLLYNWTILQSFDTARECEQERDKRRADAAADAAAASAAAAAAPTPSPGSLPSWAFAGPKPDPTICVESDDPRLTLPLWWRLW
jgi:hypothetical protein